MPKFTEMRKKSEGNCSSFSLTPRKLFTDNSSWQPKHSIPHITVTFYGDIVKMCEDFFPNFGDKSTCCRITTTHRLTFDFRQGIFDNK
jgi:hypothetical protein